MVIILKGGYELTIQNHRLHAFVSGKVQGVFYRASTEEQAKRLGLNGWVRNLTDGRVELVAVGDEDKLKQLLDWCYKGPENASVKDIHAVWDNTSEIYDDFKQRETC